MTQSVTEWSTAVIRDHDVATPALLCNKDTLWHKGPYNLCHKEPMRAKPRWTLTYESGELWDQVPGLWPGDGPTEGSEGGHHPDLSGVRPGESGPEWSTRGPSFR